MSAKPRLLLFNLVTDSANPVLGFTTAWINALARYCDQIDVLTMQKGQLDVASNVHVYSVGKEKRYSELRRAIEFYRILLTLLLRNQYDACFAHMMPLFAVMGAPLLKLWHIPITLWYAHGNVSRQLRLAEKWVDHVVTSTPEGFRLPSQKVEIIGQGIDTAIFTPNLSFAKRPFTIVTVGRITPVKRLETMIEAAHLLVNQYDLHNFKLRIVGSASPPDEVYAEHLQTLIGQYGLTNIVEFPGPITYNRVACEYQTADVMVNVGGTGSLDKAVLEAMACGIPSITANEAFQSLLAPWANQLLIPPEAEALAARVNAIAGMTPTSRQKLGAELRAVVVNQHSLERLARALMDIFGRG